MPYEIQGERKTTLIISRGYSLILQLVPGGLDTPETLYSFRRKPGNNQEFPRNVAEFFRILRKPMICTLQNPQESPGIPRNPENS